MPTRRERQLSRRAALLGFTALGLTACGPPPEGPEKTASASSSAANATPSSSTTQADSPTSSDGSAALPGAPTRFTIVPDDYHVPYAGTAADGRKFFLSEELVTDDGGWVGLFLWTQDGKFDELFVDPVTRPSGLPPGQAYPVGATALVKKRLGQLGTYRLEPITVEPFTRVVRGVTFGWRVRQYDGGEFAINIEPGDFIAYYAPWDGLEYDT